MRAWEKAAEYASGLACTPEAAGTWSCADAMATIGMTLPSQRAFVAACRRLDARGAHSPTSSNWSEYWAAVEAELRAPAKR